MDLKDFKPISDVIVVELKHPTTGDVLTNDDETPMTISRYAPHSKEYKSAVNVETNKKLKIAQSKKKLMMTAEDLEEINIRLLAETTFDWNITYGKKQPKFSVDSAKEMYEEVFWIKDQLEEAEAEYLDFTKV
jgi:hypothetical protein